MPDDVCYARSARDEIDGLVYFPRMLDKIRLMAANKLHPDLHQNLGKGMDQWTCQFFGIQYESLKQEVLSGATDEEILSWAKTQGVTRSEYELSWFNAYLKTRGFRDDLSDRLAERKKEQPHTNREDILTFMDYIEVDEGREL